MATTHILCVDDDAAVLKSLENVLLYSGFDVVAVASVPEALRMIGQQTFDVLLADLNIGEPGDGFTVVSAMRRVQPHASTFILTGYPDIESAIQAVRNQVDDYFSKPLNVPELLKAITNARTGNRALGKVARPRKMSEFVRDKVDHVCDEWLEALRADPDLASIALTREERLDDLPDLLHEIAFRLEIDDANVLTDKAVESARRHGRLRFEQGYSIPQIVFESRVLQQVLSSSIQQHLLSIDLSTLVPDTSMIGESIQAALEIAVRAYQTQLPNSLQTSFAGIYKSPHLGVAIANERYIIDANDALLRMLQHTRDQLTAREIDWQKLTPEPFHLLDANAVEQLREFGACVPYEKEFLLPDGTNLPVLIGAVRLSMEPPQWSVFVVDLTKQRKLQAAERKLREWQSRHAIINHLAHEINNPLAALTFTLHLLATHSDLSIDARNLIQTSEELLYRVSAVVKKVLAESQPAE